MGLTSQGQELESHSKCSEVSPDWTKGRTRGSGGAIEAGGHAHLTWYFQPNVTRFPARPRTDLIAKAPRRTCSSRTLRSLEPEMSCSTPRPLDVPLTLTQDAAQVSSPPGSLPWPAGATGELAWFPAQTSAEALQQPPSQMPPGPLQHAGPGASSPDTSSGRDRLDSGPSQHSWLVCEMGNTQPVPPCLNCAVTGAAKEVSARALALSSRNTLTSPSSISGPARATVPPATAPLGVAL